VPIPFNGTILAHCQRGGMDWCSRRTRTTRPSSIRICVVTVTLLPAAWTGRDADLPEAPRQFTISAFPIAHPRRLEMLAKFCVMTRLKEHENSNLTSKMRVYDGEKLKDTDPKARTLQEYKDQGGIDEGMTGISTRFAYKTNVRDVQTTTVNEIAADPVHLMYVLDSRYKREQYTR